MGKQIKNLIGGVTKGTWGKLSAFSMSGFTALRAGRRQGGLKKINTGSL